MLDVFFCTLDAKDPIREAMVALCLERWRIEKSIHLRIITPAVLGCTPREFQSKRRQYADQNTDSPIYVVTDDDCLLGLDSPIGTMVATLDSNREFAMLSMMPANAKINPWTPEGYEPFMSPFIWEHVSVGGVRFCRKGILKDWPAHTRKGYDTEQCEQIRKEGRRSGYAIQVKYNHIGEGFSTIW